MLNPNIIIKCLMQANFYLLLNKSLLPLLTLTVARSRVGPISYKKKSIFPTIPAYLNKEICVKDKASLVLSGVIC